MIISEMEARILGSLVEKEATTPDYYPMTIKSLTSACNQKSNRNPVVQYQETEIFDCLDKMRFKKWIWKVNPAGSRVVKYEHNFMEAFTVDKQQMVLLAELLLRGPQTQAELKSHASRMFPFSHNIQVETALDGLKGREEPMITVLPKQPGQKEARIAHLLCGAPIIPEITQPNQTSPGELDEIKEELAAVRSELDTLKQAFNEFKNQF